MQNFTEHARDYDNLVPRSHGGGHSSSSHIVWLETMNKLLRLSGLSRSAAICGQGDLAEVYAWCEGGDRGGGSESDIQHAV